MFTRKIERGAGSSFRVNGRELRARDVQTMFADIGSGARSSAMVSQGRVAALIQAKPEDRRAVLEEAVGPDMAACVTGDAAVAASFAAQPWDHLVFTGGTETGKRVMAAAAPHVTPLTLELGGKCPALVLPGADLARAAKDILVAKAVNAGQSCIAPDTVLLVGHRAEDFAAAARASGVKETGTQVINAAQEARLAD
jgi:hypothetical protein